MMSPLDRRPPSRRKARRKARRNRGILGFDTFCPAVVVRGAEANPLPVLEVDRGQAVREAMLGARLRVRAVLEDAMPRQQVDEMVKTMLADGLDEDSALLSIFNDLCPVVVVRGADVHPDRSRK